MAKFDFPLFYILRAVQAVFAVIVLGLTGHAVNVTDGHWWDTINFMLFNGVWTLFIVVPYFILAPIFVPAIAHRWVLVAVDTITMIFWLALRLGRVLFLVTTVLNTMGALRRDPAPGPQPPTAHVP
ncbi:hypothetical protein AN8278.2 [Aspergillus nidulans FGSC A4]|nr:hypothetical protein AN8278.2 [Aspergillus nidulans FGSC A4]|eukprot:XP_681547.1 hypothetical protein AN8278.2 [Aspergillus nidulans FGSC A4]